MLQDRQSGLTGLTEDEAARRLAADGPNELPSAKPRSFLAIIWTVVSEPMLLLLVACAAIYLTVGDRGEAVALAGTVFVIMGITLYQEQKTERTLEALRDLSSPRALVIREGRERRIPGRDVVAGDLIALSEGDRVPADAVLVRCANLALDESLLTGESVTVSKVAGAAGTPSPRPGGDNLPFVYSGTLVVRGQGIGLVRATGAHTEIGRIGRSLRDVPSSATPLQRSTNRLVRNFAVAGISLCVVVAVGYGLVRHSLFDGLLAGLTAAISLIPEEFPVVLTIFLALGAWRIARKNVLTRRVTAIETLGAATVLCVDKTGTLTQNRMSVSALSIGDTVLEIDDASDTFLPADQAGLLGCAVRASQPSPFDPMEKAFHDLARLRTAEGAAPDSRDLVRQYPLSPDFPAMANVWTAPDGNGDLVAAKGAPEAVAALCHFGDAERAALLRRVDTLAERGLRVLAVAGCRAPSGETPDRQTDFPFEFLGLIGLADPIRPMVAPSLAECYEAGIRVVMITGDYPDTARSIGLRIGLRRADRVVTGPELAAMDDDALRRAVASANIYARILPEQKLQLVRALQTGGEVVAMTGDGVNDAPALKAADIGIAMGGRGTDVAREAADMVLLDDDFSSIVQAVRSGRRIYANIRDAMAYIMAVHVPIAGLSLAPVLVGWPLILLPLHIAFLEMVTDPACSIVFESMPEDAGIMKRPPRPPSEPLFTRRAIAVSLLQGAGAFAIVMGIFAAALARGQGIAGARALTFASLVFAELGLIVSNLSWSGGLLQSLRAHFTVLRWVLAGVVGSLALVLYVPLLRALFGFSFLHPGDLLVCLAGGLTSLLWFELLKRTRAAGGAGGFRRAASQ